MIAMKPILLSRMRKLNGRYAFIELRFRYFIHNLTQREILLYLFLVLVSDHQGLSSFSPESICAFLKISLKQYLKARELLIHKDMIAFDGQVFQILSLPAFSPWEVPCD
jgi:hypothetical protein